MFTDSGENMFDFGRNWTVFLHYFNPPAAF